MRHVLFIYNYKFINKKKKIDYFIKKKIDDKIVEKYREIYFNNI